MGSFRVRRRNLTQNAWAGCNTFEISEFDKLIYSLFIGGNVFSKKNSPKKNKNKIGRGRQTTTTPAPTTTTEEPTTTTINKRLQQQIMRARKVEIVDIFNFSATRGAIWSL